jgi:hypothetical protein
MRRHDAHLLGPELEHPRDLVAVHVRRLSRCMHLDALADAARPAGFGLDIGVLHEARPECAFGDGGTSR